jgi:SSS family solute:Na+ symporter
MSLLWLTFLNIFVGVFIAFVFLGGPTRSMGHRLDAHTFPEFLARRFESKFIQIFAGLIIFAFIPIYAAAVLVGGCAFIAAQFGISFNTALLIFSVLIAAYVVVGGLKGVMYTDALQGSIMFIGMILLIAWTYSSLGGITEAHKALSEAGKGPNIFGSVGFKGWTAMPEFGWGVAGTPEKPNPAGYNLWWIVVSTITLGVGIGVLAQPQLAVRFMTVKSKRELNRAVLIGGVFILIMTGVAFVGGSLSNVYFLQQETLTGKLVNVTGVGAKPTEWSWVVAKKEPGINVKPDGTLVNPAIGPDEKSVPCVLIHLDTSGDDQPDVHLIYKGYGRAAAITPAAEIEGLEAGADPTGLIGEKITVKPKATAYMRAIVKYAAQDAQGNDRVVYECKTSRIIPFFIGSAMPKWFGLLFLLTLLAAAMSTLSSQFHAVGTSIGRDVYEQITGKHGQSVAITRIGIVLGIVIAVVISNFAKGGYFIARATAIFFGLCASAFLPTFLGALFWKRMTKAGAVCSMIIGFIVTAFWLLFIKDKEARVLGFCDFIFGKPSLLLDKPNWSVVDPIVIALPISIIVAIVVSLLTKPPSQEHIEKCFKK